MYLEKDLLIMSVADLANIVHDLQCKLDTSEVELKLTTSINDELSAKVVELSAAASKAPVAASASGISTETFEVNGEKYGFAKRGINYKGAVIGAAEVLASSALQAELVKIGSGMIKKM